MNDEAELTYTRVFDAPRELVFRCMLEPEHLTHFWGPAGMTTPLDGITVDPRPGGVFEALMVSDSDGSSYTMRAVYLEIVAPERIVWSEPGTGMVTTSTFTELARPPHGGPHSPGERPGLRPQPRKPGRVPDLPRPFCRVPAHAVTRKCQCCRLDSNKTPKDLSGLTIRPARPGKGGEDLMSNAASPASNAASPASAAEAMDMVLRRPELPGRGRPHRLGRPGPGRVPAGLRAGSTRSTPRRGPGSWARSPPARATPRTPTTVPPRG